MGPAFSVLFIPLRRMGADGFAADSRLGSQSEFFIVAVPIVVRVCDRTAKRSFCLFLDLLPWSPWSGADALVN